VYTRFWWENLWEGVHLEDLDPCISAALKKRICVKFDIGTFMSVCRENPNMVKIGQNIRHFT
jgi:hypothetical protein